jgi:hypothetical protein
MSWRGFAALAMRRVMVFGRPSEVTAESRPVPAIMLAYAPTADALYIWVAISQNTNPKIARPTEFPSMISDPR